MLERGKDSALLRFSIGTEYLKGDDPVAAADHLAQALELDPNYSAAWKLYAQALGEAGRVDEAMKAYADGINVAEARGDRQAAKEMGVFLRRLKKRVDADPT